MGKLRIQKSALQEMSEAWNSGVHPSHHSETKPFKIQRIQQKEKHNTERNIPKTHLTKATKNPITLANQKQTVITVCLL